jgi:hypothetical protein
MLGRMILVAFLTSTAFAVEPALETEQAPIPEGLSESVKGALDSAALTVSMEGEAIARFWLGSELKAAASPSSELGVTFGKVESGSFVGVVQFLKEWSDYKKTPIQPGVYTLRYGIMPADGNHMGVATYRDFLLLLPPSTDQDPAKSFDYGELVVSSVEVAGVPHPGVLALFPIWDEVTEPKLVKNDLDQWTLAIKIGEDALGLVVEGHGEIEGY